VPEIDAPLLHDVRVDLLAMPSGLPVPGGDGPLIEPEGGDDGLSRAAVGPQRQDGGDQVVGGPLAIEGGAPSLGEGATAGGAPVAAFGTAMDPDVAPPDHAACGAIGVVAELRPRVHRQLSPDPVWRPSPG